MASKGVKKNRTCKEFIDDYAEMDNKELLSAFYEEARHRAICKVKTAFCGKNIHVLENEILSRMEVRAW